MTVSAGSTTSIGETADATADRVLSALADGEQRRARTGAAARRDLLLRFGDLVAELAGEWVTIAASI